MPINTCVVSGNVTNLLGQAVENCVVSVAAVAPFFHSGSWISGQQATVNTDASGNFSVELIETETVGRKLTFTLTAAHRTPKKYAVVIPDAATANLSDLVAADTSPITSNTFPAINVTVTPVGNLASTNAQAALEELQGDIDGLNALADGKIYVGDASNTAQEVTPSGDATMSNAGVIAISAGVIVDADINASAGINASKLADGTVSNAELQYINSLSSNAQTQLTNNATAISDHIVDTSAAHAASAISSTPSGNLAATDVQAALNELQTDVDSRATATALTDHINDSTDAHAASAITNTPSGNLAAITVQGALNELQTDVDTRATTTALNDHINDATDAHAASAITNTPSGNLAATTVQGALNELQTDVDTRATSSALTAHTGASSGAHAASAISFTPVGTIAATDTQTAVAEVATDAASALSTHEADTTSIHGITDTSVLALGVSSAVDSEVALFSSTGGKQLKRATGTGPAKLASGVLSAAAINLSGSEITSTLGVANGGTGATTLTAHGVLVGNGTGAVAITSAGSATQVLTSNGASADPTFQAVPFGNYAVTTQTGTYSILTSDNLVLCSGAAFTVTLPTASGVTGKTYTIKKTDSTLANVITIATTSSQTIDGSTTRKLCTLNETVTVVSNGSNWIVTDHKCSTEWGTTLNPSFAAGFGTLAVSQIQSRRVGDSLCVRGYVKIGTVAASEASLTQATGVTIDTTKLSTTNKSQCVGWTFNYTATGSNTAFGNSGGGESGIYFDTGASTKVYLGYRGNTALIVAENVDAMLATSAGITFEYLVPVADWWD